MVRLGQVKLLIEQKNCFSYIFFQIERFYLVILALYNLKTKCDRRKPSVDLESLESIEDLEKKYKYTKLSNFHTIANAIGINLCHVG